MCVCKHIHFISCTGKKTFYTKYKKFVCTWDLIHFHVTQYKILQIIAYIKYNTIQDNTTQNSIQYIYNIIDCTCIKGLTI